MFQFHIETYFSEYILCAENPPRKNNWSIIKTEYHVWGSPQAHCLLLVDGALGVDTDSNEDVCASFDIYISGIIPDDKPEDKEIRNYILQLLTHIHPQYCHCNDLVGLASPNSHLHRNLLLGKCKVIQLMQRKHWLNQLKIFPQVHAAIEENTDDDITVEDIFDTTGVSIDEYMNS